MRKRLLMLALALPLGCATLRRPGSLEGWRELSSQHFVLQTELQDAAARELIISLERYRAAVLLALGVELKHSPRLKVVAFESSWQLTELGFAPGVGGVLRHTPAPVMALVPASAISTLPMGITQAHELAHYFAAFVFPRQPAWFAEGLAEYLATISVSADGREAILGRPNLLRLDHARFPLPLDTLWSWRPRAESGSDQSEMARGYASSWLWVHFLLNAHGDRFEAFMKAMASGVEPRLAFDRAFAGVSRASLDTHVADYVKRTQQYQVFRYVIPAIRSEVAVRSMSAQEALWAKFEVSISRAADVALGEEARRRFPGSPEALLIAASLAQGDAGLSTRLYREAFTRYGDDPRVAIEAASHARLFPPDERERISVWALELAPYDARAVLARVQVLLESSRAAEAVPLVRDLVRLAPSSSGAMGSGSAVLASVGQCDGAATLADRARAALPERLPEQQRTEFLAKLQRPLEACRTR